MTRFIPHIFDFYQEIEKVGEQKYGGSYDKYQKFHEGL
jgi:hypothetical protein